ncbi:MAG: universal stress protein [Nocardioides alkalitolerans]
MNAPVVVLHAPSEAGAAALLSAARLSREKDAPLVVVATSSGVDDDRSEEVEREVAVGQVTAVIGAPDGETPWTLDLVRPGADAAAMLVGAVEAHEPRLLVIGSRQRSPLGKMLLGRTLQRLLLEVSVPVLVVKAGRPLDDGTP